MSELSAAVSNCVNSVSAAVYNCVNSVGAAVYNCVNSVSAAVVPDMLLTSEDIKQKERSGSAAVYNCELCECGCL